MESHPEFERTTDLIQDLFAASFFFSLHQANTRDGPGHKDIMVIPAFPEQSFCKDRVMDGSGWKRRESSAGYVSWTSGSPANRNEKGAWLSHRGPNESFRRTNKATNPGLSALSITVWSAVAI